MRYRVTWTNPSTGATGHGEWMDNEVVAHAWVNKCTKDYPEMVHSLEMCHGEAHAMSDDKAIDWQQHDLGINRAGSSVGWTDRSITFQVGATWALRISRSGIVANPDVPIDGAAKAIVEAMTPYIKQLSN